MASKKKPAVTKGAKAQASLETHTPLGSAEDPNILTELGDDQVERLERVKRLTSKEVDRVAIRQYLELDVKDLTHSSAQLGSLGVQDALHRKLDANASAEKLRKTLLCSMNRVTVVELATLLDCYHPERILKGKTSEWLADPIKGPVIERIMEIEGFLQSLGPQAERLIEQGIKNFRPQFHAPSLPCSLLKALRYVTKADVRIKAKFLETAFRDYVRSLSEFPPGEPFRLCTAVKAGLPFPDEKSRPDKEPACGKREQPHSKVYQSKTAKERADLIDQLRVQSMAVTELATVAWLMGGFREFWRKTRSAVREANMEDLQKDDANRKTKIDGAEGSNNSQEHEKWIRITKAYVKFHVGKDVPDTKEGRESILKEFAPKAHEIDSGIENASRHTHKKIRVFLETFMNHGDDDHEIASAEIFEKLSNNKKPPFKSVTKEAIKECLKELDGAGLITTL